MTLRGVPAEGTTWGLFTCDIHPLDPPGAFKPLHLRLSPARGNPGRPGRWGVVRVCRREHWGSGWVTSSESHSQAWAAVSAAPGLLFLSAPPSPLLWRQRPESVLLCPVLSYPVLSCPTLFHPIPSPPLLLFLLLFSFSFDSNSNSILSYFTFLFLFSYYLSNNFSCPSILLLYFSDIGPLE